MSYLVVYAIFVYFVPLIIIIYCYTFIVMQVSAHEKSLRAQAKKMNIASLRANEDNKKASAEFRLAKVCIILNSKRVLRNCFLYFGKWFTI